MTSPSIELIPSRPVVTSDRETTLDMIVRIHPPAQQQKINRPPLNLGLVLDRSGSMSGNKIRFARKAACYAVEQLLPTDRVSVTIFDTHVQTLVASTLVEDKTSILNQIQRVQTGSSTALHKGWVEGGIQVSQHLNPKALNRVILLSDGLANVGETNPDSIANDVHGLSVRGVGTTTLGVGEDYDEDLLAAMATSGDGNFYHIESPDQLPEIFATELQGLVATVGHKVSLGLEPAPGVVIKDVFNDLEKTSYGRLMLPNLVVGQPLTVVLRLRIPASNQERKLCEFRLAWNEVESRQRRTVRTSLQLPVIPAARLDEYPLNLEVQEQVSFQQAARARREAISRMDANDMRGVQDSLQQAREVLACAPESAERQAELDQLSQVEAKLQQGKRKQFRKDLYFQSYERSRGRSRGQNKPQS